MSSQAFTADPQNHCVPIYETLRMPDDDDKTILVMPLLRSWYNPRLQTVGEAVDLFGQLFEVHNCNEYHTYDSVSIFAPPLGFTIHAQAPCRAPVCLSPRSSVRF